VFGIPASRLPLALALLLLLGLALWALQRRFDETDVKKGIALALAEKPGGGASVLEALLARGEGDPRCDGRVVSDLFGDIEVICSTPRAPSVEYRFRVLLDHRKPPRAESTAAAELLRSLGPTARPSP
jgi:hypothetical protein